VSELDNLTAELDDLVHQRTRLGILTVALEAKRVEFGYILKTLELTAGNLSGHLAILEDAGLVRTTKGYAGRRPRTWVSITRPGSVALRAEIDTLRAIVLRVDGATRLQPKADPRLAPM
jgi:DNA-binding MarR family transcriptional regulator